MRAEQLLTTHRDVSHDAAMLLLGHFNELCEQRGLALAIGVVDRSGNLITALRRDGAQVGAMSLAIDKAFTAIAFEAPTSTWAEVSQPGKSDWGLAATVGGRIVVLPGGAPIFLQGELVGGVGISGTAASVDEEFALALVEAAGFEAS